MNELFDYLAGVGRMLKRRSRSSTPQLFPEQLDTFAVRRLGCVEHSERIQHAIRGPDNKPLSARLSIILLPTNKTTRSLIGSATGQVSVSYAFNSLGEHRFLPHLDLDYGHFTRHGNRVEPISLLAAGLFPASKNGWRHGVHAGLERGR